MSNMDKVKMTMPDNTVFEATKNVSVTEQHQSQWLFDGFGTFRTLAEKTPFVDNATSQAYVGTGSRKRTWTVEFLQFEESTDNWGSTNSSDDVLVKINALGQKIADLGIDGTNPVVLEFGEYSSGGAHGSLTVVPAEVNLPVQFGPGESATTFTPSITWMDSADLDTDIHSAP